jgi:hypothetical protein
MTLTDCILIPPLPGAGTGLVILLRSRHVVFRNDNDEGSGWVEMREVGLADRSMHALSRIDDL